jgi:hypothetical protein
LVELVLAGPVVAGLLIGSAGGKRRRVGNASLLNAMVGEIEANVNGIAIPRA